MAAGCLRRLLQKKLPLKPERDWSLSNYSRIPPHFPLPLPSICLLSISSLPLLLLQSFVCLVSVKVVQLIFRILRHAKLGIFSHQCGRPCPCSPKSRRNVGTEMCFLRCFESISGIPSKADFQNGSRERTCPTVRTHRGAWMCCTLISI